MMRASVLKKQEESRLSCLVSSTTLWLALLLVVAGAMRLIDLGSFPSNLMADEADNLTFIFKVLYGNGPGLFGLDWKPSPAFSMYVTAPFVALFNNSVFGLRFLPALVSIAALIPMYRLYRRYVSPAAAVLSLALLSANVWYLNFSRSGWENVYVVLETAVAFWLLHLALEREQWRYWAFTGVAATIGLYSYFAGRAILIALVVYAPFALWQHRDRMYRVAIGYTLMVLVALALFVPQLPSIQANPERFNLRAERVSALHAARTGYFGHEGVPSVLLYQIERNARFFFDGSVLDGPSYSPPEQLLKDTRPRYSPFGKPLIAPLSAVLFAAGMLISLFRFGRYSVWWVMLLVPWFVTQVLTINTPDGARGIGMLVPIYFFVALSMSHVWDFVHHQRFVRATLIAIVLVAAILSVRTYFVWGSSTEFLNAREPAIPLTEYEEWSQFQIQQARADKPPVPVSVWEQMRNGK